MMRKIVFLFLSILLWQCSSTQMAVVPETYPQQVEEWKQKRLQNLIAPTGWLSLVGLEWLKEGENTFGADPENAIQLPSTAPAVIGKYILENGKVRAEILPDLAITISEDGISEMGHGALQWFLIQRGDRFGIRMRDTTLPSRILLAPIPYYPVEENYYVGAKFKPAAENASLKMRNVLDMELDVPIEGTLRFELNGQKHETIALDGGPNDLFLIISDETTGEETYGGGRYIYCPRADEKGRTIIDFNKAYNPPCAFTEFATCLLPLPQNYIPVPILAGEKKIGNH